MSKRPYQFKVFRDLDEGWMWALQAPNGAVIAKSSKGYETRQHAVRSARDVMTAIQTADLVCP
jgi:uncharacterized protein YegP (UPF0339 family)